MIPADIDHSTPAAHLAESDIFGWEAERQRLMACARGADDTIDRLTDEADYTLRDRMRAAVERLEALADEIVRQLDELNGDPDLEDDAAGEMALGGLGDEASQIHWGERVSYSGDLEGEHDGREPEELEHNLGRSEAIDQTRFEPGQDDLEWSLGAANPSSWQGQQAWGAYHTGLTGGDAEWQCEDEGAVFDDEHTLGWQNVGGNGPKAHDLADRDLIAGYANVGDEHL